MKPHFHLRKPRSTNEAQRTKKCCRNEKWNCSCERRGAGREIRQGMQKANYDSWTVSMVYSIVVIVGKQIVAYFVVNFVGSHNLSAQWLPHNRDLVILIGDGGGFVSASIEIRRRVQNFLGVFHDAMLSYGSKCSEMLFEVERKENKFNRNETRHQFDMKTAPA